MANPAAALADPVIHLNGLDICQFHCAINSSSVTCGFIFRAQNTAADIQPMPAGTKTLLGHAAGARSRRQPRR
jgi:hypothetical protein